MILSFSLTAGTLNTYDLCNNRYYSIPLLLIVSIAWETVERFKLYPQMVKVPVYHLDFMDKLQVTEISQRNRNL